MRKLLISAVLLFIPMQGIRQTIVVPVQNASFEPSSALENYPSDPCGVRGRTLSGWQFGAGSGILQLANPNSCGIASPPDGGTVAYAGYGSAFSQDLGVSPAQLQAMPGKPSYHVEGIYIFKFSIANYFPSYPGYYEAKISFGTQELCETTGWGTRNFKEITLTCPSPGYLIVDKALPSGGPVQGQQNLVITFSAQGWTQLFDDVSLTFSPENP